MTRRECRAILRTSAGLLRQATRCRNAAAAATELTELPGVIRLAHAWRTQASDLDDLSAQLSELILETHLG